MLRHLSTKDLGRRLLRGELRPKAHFSTAYINHDQLPLTTAPAFKYVRKTQRCYSSSPSSVKGVPLRKQLKEEAKKAKGSRKQSKGDSQTVEGWELTVGVEIHAQLNTGQKLFSPAVTSSSDDPNIHIAPVDVALPGSQPLFQKEVVIPALRAAMALNCDIQPVSRFDRKHYFWWDQPSGYQITQFYEPFAKNGHITVLARDGIAAEDGDGVTVGIKQVQLEQDTAKTLAQEQNEQWLDFNRVGVPLIEIITEPEVHHPRTAAVLVRKIQLLLNTVDACVSGMEVGGLRADINVSVRRTDDKTKTLGTRTEIKNLSTIKAVEDAIIAERDRQIRQLENGEVILGETRGWTLGTKETRRLRGKEGEVDYRYMPDPDVPPLIIEHDLIQYLKRSLPVVPDAELDNLISHYGMSSKDAISLVNLDNGARIMYFYNVLGQLEDKLAADTMDSGANAASQRALASNWTLHELGRLTSRKAGPMATGELKFTNQGDCEQVPARELAQLLYHLYRKQITGKVAKELLLALYIGDLEDGVLAAIDANDLWFREITQDEYAALAQEALEGEGKLLKELAVASQYPQGKLMYLVGKMMRLGPTESIDPATAERTMRVCVDRKQEA